MTTPAEEFEGVTVQELTREHSCALLDADCRAYLGIGAGEFAIRYNAGAYDDPDDDPKLMRLAIDLEFLQCAVSVH